MWPDWVSNLEPLTYEPGALPTALRGPAFIDGVTLDTTHKWLYTYSILSHNLGNSADHHR